MNAQTADDLTPMIQIGARMNDGRTSEGDARVTGVSRSVADEARAEEINWTLLQHLATKPHRLLNIADDFHHQLTSTPPSWIGEVFQEARSAHHLLDLVGIPARRGYPSNLDARTYLAIRRIQTAEERLSRIGGWHARETGPAGTVGDYCVECGHVWQCDTRRMTDGTYADDDAAGGESS